MLARCCLEEQPKAPEQCPWCTLPRAWYRPRSIVAAGAAARLQLSDRLHRPLAPKPLEDLPELLAVLVNRAFRTEVLALCNIGYLPHQALVTGDLMPGNHSYRASMRRPSKPPVGGASSSMWMPPPAYDTGCMNSPRWFGGPVSRMSITRPNRIWVIV